MVNSMVSRLADRLAEDGNDLAGWLRLARSYVVLNRAEDARAALDKAKVNFAGNEDALNQIATAEQHLGLKEATPVAEASQPSSEDVEAAQSMTADERREMIEGMVARLAERLDENGDDIEGWIRLIRSYAVLRKHDEARKALDKAEVQFAGDDEALARIKDARNQLGLNKK